MGLSLFSIAFPWYRYSKKLAAKIDTPRCVGIFREEEGATRDMRVIKGTQGSIAEGNMIEIYWMVDIEDGIIVDAKFQVFGQSALIGAAEVACQLAVGKNYEQAKRFTTELLDKHVRDKPDTPAFPPETTFHLELALAAMRDAAQHCIDIPIAANYTAPPMPENFDPSSGEGYPGWETLTPEQKIAVIEEVMDKEIRPYIALDGGGVEVLSLDNDREVRIRYQGACTSCYSSVGATLSAIQNMLRSKVHTSLNVIPE